MLVIQVRQQRFHMRVFIHDLLAEYQQPAGPQTPSDLHEQFVARLGRDELQRVVEDDHRCVLDRDVANVA